MWLLELWLALTVAVAAPPEVVLTFDNGGFNAPLYAPRWTGFAKPSVAREIATSVARVAGENPHLYTYLPPGRVEGRPGEPYRIVPRVAGCEGAAEAPSDPCFCGPGDRCWGELDVNRHPAGSTSLYLTAAALRDPARGDGPRLEVHFTDLFEEDPSTAENPADTDKCVTRAGVRKAVEGLVVGDVDHLAVGLLRARIDAPPPGSNVGSVFTFVEGEGGCWSGRREGAWTAGSDPLDWAMGVVVVGIGTEGVHEQVVQILSGLEVQLQSDHMALSLVQLREPASVSTLETSLGADALADWRSPPSALPTEIPCTAVDAKASLSLDGQALDQATATGDCGGVIELQVSRSALQGAWVRAHGLDPFAGDGVLTGSVVLTGSGDAAVEALAALEAVNDQVAGRPLAFFDVVAGLARSGAGGMTAFRREIALTATITGLQGPAWLGSTMIGLIFAMATALAAHQFLLRTAARRAYQAAWDRAVDADDDPLRQRPVAAVLAEAQDDLRRGWIGRWVAAGVVAVMIGLVMTAILLRLSLVLLV